MDTHMIPVHLEKEQALLRSALSNEIHLTNALFVTPVVSMSSTQSPQNQIKAVIQELESRIDKINYIQDRSNQLRNAGDSYGKRI